MPLDAEMFLANAVRAARLAAAEVWEPPPPVDFTQWATENVVFGNESPKPGAYDPDYHPWDRFFFEALQPDHPAREVIDVGSAQSGKTLRAQIFVGGSQALDPGPMIVYHPTLPNAISWAQQKWRIFVRNTRALAKLFPVGKSRDVGNSMLYQERADGRGHVEIAGANSPAALSQRSKPKQVQDDLSKWELNSAGDPETQADNRSRAFAWAKNYKISTPLMNPGCKISRKYKLSTQGEFHLPCPHCAALAPLTWDNFRLSVEAMIEARKHGKPETPAHFTCGSCGAVIEEKHRAGMLKGIACVHKNLEAGAKLGIWGFYVWAAYVPGESWASIAEGWIAAAGDPSREQVFYNDTLGLPYEVQGEAPPWEKIRERAEATGHALGRIPAGGIMLTIGADCQGDRVEWHCKAFGRDGRRWTIEYGVIDGHISEDRAKAGLDALLRRTWRDAFGNKRAADMIAIDGNFAKEDVRDWVKRYPQDRAIMVRGIRGDAAPAMTLVKEDKTADGQVIKTQKRFWNVGVSSLKAALYKALNKTDPLAKGFCGYPKGLTEEFFKQLCAENRRPFKVKKTGATEWRWVQIEGQANEVLDTEMYAEAAARRLGWKRFTDKDWDRLTAEREQPAPDRQLDLEEPNLLAQGPKRAPAAAPRETDHEIEAPQAGPDDRGGIRSGISRPGYLRRR
jgi:phage terminase large subunit GpA-like protein